MVSIHKRKKVDEKEFWIIISTSHKVSELKWSLSWLWLTRYVWNFGCWCWDSDTQSAVSFFRNLHLNTSWWISRSIIKSGKGGIIIFYPGVILFSMVKMNNFPSLQVHGIWYFLSNHIFAFVWVCLNDKQRLLSECNFFI